MKKLLTLFATMLALSIQAFAQDIITLQNEDELNVNFKNVSQKEVINDDHSSLKSDDKIYAHNINAIHRGMSYSQLQQIYDYKDYATFTGNLEYEPVAMGIASAFVPGLGQIIAGEVGRGLLYFFGTEGLLIIAGVIAQNTHSSVGEAPSVLCCIGALTLHIFDVIDAVRVSKVKNMYFSDLNQLACDIKITPFVDLAYTHTPNMQPVTGLSLNISF